MPSTKFQAPKGSGSEEDVEKNVFLCFKQMILWAGLLWARDFHMRKKLDKGPPGNATY